MNFGPKVLVYILEETIVDTRLQTPEPRSYSPPLEEV